MSLLDVADDFSKPTVKFDFPGDGTASGSSSTTQVYSSAGKGITVSLSGQDAGKWEMWAAAANSHPTFEALQTLTRAMLQTVGAAAREKQGLYCALGASGHMIVKAYKSPIAQFMPSDHSAAINTITNLKSNVSDWGSIVPPSDETIADVLAFLATLPNETPTPQIAVAQDGEISLEWNASETKRAAVDFSGDKYFGYAYLAGKTFVPGRKQCAVCADGLPEDLKEYLSQ